MKAIRLVTVSDDYDTTPGFIIKGTPNFEGLMADRTGATIAHDLLEHQNGMEPMGKVWDELEALGGIWYVRGQWGDFDNNFYTPAYQVATDVTRMFSQWLSEDNMYNGPGGLIVGSRAHLYDDDFREIIAIARDKIPHEHNDMGTGEPGEPANGWAAQMYEYRDEYLKLALHRMRSGFRKAQRRFERGNASRFYGNNMFAAVRDAVKNAARDIDWEGQEFILSYGNGEAKCRPVHEYEEY